MKVYIGPFVDRWICRFEERWIAWRYKKVYWEVDDKDRDKWDRLAEKIDEILQRVYNFTINLYLDKKKRKIKVKVHKYDSWSADITLAHIILPVLKQLKESKHGSPQVSPDDVPPNLRPTLEEIVAYRTNGTTDDKFHERWAFVLNEMIWTFEQLIDEDAEDQFYDDKTKSYKHPEFEEYNKRIDYGCRMFGKYYRSLWD
jgi:hypothetical protein